MVGTFGNLWEPVGNLGNLWELWEPWEPLGTCWEPLGTLGTLGTFGNLWELPRTRVTYALPCGDGGAVRSAAPRKCS